MQAPDKLLALMAVAVLVAGAIGFAVEVDPDRYRLRGFSDPVMPSPAAPTVTGEVATPARTYDELSVRPWGSGPDAGWKVDGARLRAAFDEHPAPTSVERADTPTALAERAVRRAFQGAPPTIPHPVAPSGAAECLACHEHGATLGRLVARPIPHAAYASCTQCHVTAAASPPFEPSASGPSSASRPRDAEDAPPNAAPVSASRFEPLRPAPMGPRVWPGAPPALPHSTHMRERCLACHGPGGRPGMHSSHPDRASCLQCHAPSADLEQRASATREGERTSSLAFRSHGVSSVRPGGDPSSGNRP